MTTAAPLQYAEQGRLTISTSGNWDFTDLRSFLDAIELCYGVFLGLDFLDTMQEALDDPRGPAIDHLGLLAQLTEGWPSSGARAATFFERVGGIDLLEEERKFLLTLRLSAYREYPLGALRIVRIQMASPGVFSFKGLGEPLYQLREFIKDLWYRNSQERRLGEVRIEAARLFLKEAKRTSRLRNPESIDRAVLFLADGARRLQRLEDAEKLSHVVEDISADEPDDE